MVFCCGGLRELEKDYLPLRPGMMGGRGFQGWADGRRGLGDHMIYTGRQRLGDGMILEPLALADHMICWAARWHVL